MSTHASALGDGPPDHRRANRLDFAVAVWTVAVVAAALGLVGLPHWKLIAAGFPAALIAVAATGLAQPSERERFAALWAIVLGAGLVGAALILRNAEWALAIPAIGAVGVLSARWPAATVIGLFAIAGSYQSVLALTSVQVYKVADVVLAGLAAGVVWGLLVRRP